MTEDKISGYDLSRNFWNWAFDNPEKISPNHAAVYFFAVEHCNRLGWKEKFGFPSQMAMDAIGIKKHSTYIRYFRDLVEYKFFTLIQESKNQYSSNIISLFSALPKKGEALDKAMVKHGAKQSESIGQSKRSINKQVNKEQINNNIITDFENLKTQLLEDQLQKESTCMSLKITPEFYTKKTDVFISESKATEKANWKNYSEFKKHFFYWLKNEVQNGNHKSKDKQQILKSIPKPIKQDYR